MVDSVVIKALSSNASGRTQIWNKKNKMENLINDDLEPSSFLMNLIMNLIMNLTMNLAMNMTMSLTMNNLLMNLKIKTVF